MVFGAARAGGGAGPGRAVDGHLPGLPRGGRGGCDNRANRHESVSSAGPARRPRLTSISRETGSPGEDAPTPMAFRDSWHRALVYFGLAEEYHDEFEEPPSEAELEDRYRERPNVRRLRRRRDEYEDIFAEDDSPQDAGAARGRSATAL